MSLFSGCPFAILPLELREEIWTLALRPDPSVYRFDPDDFTPTEETNGFEDDRWLLPKPRFPAAAHVCRESWRLALKIMEREQASGAPKTFFLGEPARVFDPDNDTMWFDSEDNMFHDWVMNLRSVIGKRVHIIQRLALSSSCIWSTANVPKEGISSWDLYRWDRLPRYVSLQHLDVVFGTNCDTAPSLHTTGATITDIKLAPWLPGCSDETEEQVMQKMDKTIRDVRQGFQSAFEDREEEQRRLPLPDDAPSWQDGSAITFRAAWVLPGLDKT
ncbi:hypothetical protein N0V93_002018 [Gnomoniopsis smithogilvyi]|uniref:2EXR domain-containing protein n=1 Tax=Gnomoniopsis smithogilvyi TaxID=1191159 RepID=A0A9W8Z2R0_9PEZI|nr:hypothetical protein N0V93_002018 [Gnomoniopsis smithogilvyi]